MRDSILHRSAPSFYKIVLFRQLWWIHAVFAEHRNLASSLTLMIFGQGAFSNGGEVASYVSLVPCHVKIWSIVTDGEYQTMSSGTGGAQDWRAVACLAPTGERLLCVGESSSQVRAAYTGAWGEVIRDEDRPTVRAISLQRWAGQFWSGQWEHQMYLAVPTARSGKGGPGEVAEVIEEEEPAPAGAVKAKKKA
jgi:hypothetical protein